MPRSPLERFNTAPAERAAAVLRACNAAPRFAAELLAGRPYPTGGELVARAEEVSRALPWDEVLAALAAHPRIGERAAGSSAAAAASRREQRGLGSPDEPLRAELHAANRAYEERFGTVFLIRAAGRTAAEVLAELHRRLGNGAAAERAEVTEQLAQITGLRVRGVLDPDATGDPPGGAASR